MRLYEKQQRFPSPYPSPNYKATNSQGGSLFRKVIDDVPVEGIVDKDGVITMGRVGLPEGVK